MASLLLIDTSVRLYQEIAAAAKPTTAIILFDSATSSLDDIVGQVNALSARSFTSVGLVQDGTNMMASYQIVQTQPPCELLGLETTGLASWSPVVEFLQSLKTLTGMTTFDFISCLLGANEGFAYAITQISSQLDLTLQASKDRTGNLAEGGNWTQESSGINIQNEYFTEAIAQYTGVLYTSFDNQHFSDSNQMVTAANPGYRMVGTTNIVLGAGQFSMTAAVKPVGTQANGLLPSGYPGTLPVQSVQTNKFATAYLYHDGSIQVYGNQYYGGSRGGEGTITSYPDPPTHNYTVIASTSGAFTALYDDTATGGTYGYVKWGQTSSGGNTATDGTYYTDVTSDSLIIAIASNEYAFATLDDSGKITAWGDTVNGGGSDVPTGTGYTAIATTPNAFAALHLDGTIYAWGNSGYGGTGGPTDSGYTSIVGNGYAFAALGTGGKIVTWGNSFYGPSTSPAGTGYTTIAASGTGFAALKSDGSITSWGVTNNVPTDTGYTALVANYTSFAALHSSGKISSWGSYRSGVPTDTGYTAIAASANGFAALKSDGSIRAWGYSGDIANAPSSSTTGFTMIAASLRGFAALKSDGTVFSWGNSSYGGLGAISGTAYTQLVGLYNGFAAAKNSLVPTNIWSLSTVTFGDPDYIVSEPSSNSSGAFSYFSNDTAIATISRSGTIHIVAVGNVIITATQTRADNYTIGTTTTQLTIEAAPLPVAPTLGVFSIPEKTFNDPNFSVIPPTTNSSGTFSYESSDTTVATVSSSGEISIKKVGTATITATQAATRYYFAKTVSATLTINKATPILSLSLPSKTFGDPNFTVNVTQPTPVSNGALSYVSSNTTVATVSSSGVISIKSAGQTIITVTQAAAGNYSTGTASAQLLVDRATPTLSWSDPSSGLTQIQGTAFVLPGATSASTGAVTYTAINDPPLTGEVATFVKNGTGNNVTFNQIGAITITATQAAAGNYNEATATKTFTVNGPPSFAYSSLSTSQPKEGQYFTLTGYGTNKLAVFTAYPDGKNFVDAVTNANTNKCTTLVVQYTLNPKSLTPTYKYVVCSIGTTGIHTVSGNDNATTPNTHSVSLTVPTGTTLVLGPQFTRPLAGNSNQTLAQARTLNVNIFVRTIKSDGSIDTTQVTIGEIVTAADSAGIAKVQIQRYNGDGLVNPLSWTVAGIVPTSGTKTYSPASTAVNTIAISLPGQ